MITWVEIKRVMPNPNNPRAIRDARFEKLKQSIIDFPEMLEKRPLVCYTEGKNYIVLGGNMRLKALQDIGHGEVPIMLADEWTEEQRAQFLIKDNVGFGEWDWNTLANEWDADKLEAWGLELPPMDAIELAAEEDDYEMPEQIETDIVLGDLFEIGEHRLLCGDSTDSDQVEKLMNGDKCNLLTDPPYGINANKQTLGTGKKQFHRGENWDNEVPDFYYVLQFVDKAIIWGGNYFADKLPINNDWLCWHKKNDGLSFSEFELAWTNLGKNCRMLSHHWGGEIKEHPTMKPLKLMEWCINYLDSKPILDIFCGSGSTMVASHQLKRKCYGMELDPKYCQVIIDRMIKLDPTLEIKRNGQTYNRQTTDGQ
jgi:DNA modification methylase